jgi:hypothetical protein
MSEPLVYRECRFTRVGTLPETVGSFIIGIPSKAIKEYRKDHPPTDTIDEAFRSLVSKEEIEQMEGILRFVNMSRHEYYPFDGDPLRLGAPTSGVPRGESFGSYSRNRQIL